MKFFGIILRGLFCKFFQDGLEFSAGLGGCHSRAEFQRSSEIDMRVLRDMQREIDLSVAPFEARRHHADDLISLVHELDFAANNIGIAQEVSLPELIAEDHDTLRLLSIGSVGRNQPAALESGNAPVVGRVR